MNAKIEKIRRRREQLLHALGEIEADKKRQDSEELQIIIALDKLKKNYFESPKGMKTLKERVDRYTSLLNHLVESDEPRHQCNTTKMTANCYKEFDCNTERSIHISDRVIPETEPTLRKREIVCPQESKLIKVSEKFSSCGYSSDKSSSDNSFGFVQPSNSNSSSTSVSSSRYPNADRVKRQSRHKLRKTDTSKYVQKTNVPQENFRKSQSVESVCEMVHSLSMNTAIAFSTPQNENETSKQPEVQMLDQIEHQFVTERLPMSVNISNNDGPLYEDGNSSGQMLKHTQNKLLENNNLEAARQCVNKLQKAQQKSISLNNLSKSKAETSSTERKIAHPFLSRPSSSSYSVHAAIQRVVAFIKCSLPSFHHSACIILDQRPNDLLERIADALSNHEHFVRSHLLKHIDLYDKTVDIRKRDHLAFEIAALDKLRKNILMKTNQLLSLSNRHPNNLFKLSFMQQLKVLHKVFIF